MSGSEQLPQIIAHRGASEDAPENTLAAFQLALEQGADAVEGDFRLSKDGTIVCIHDSHGRRTLQKNVEIKKTPFEALRKLSAGSWKGKQWVAEKIPTLEEILDLLPENVPLYLEVKAGPEFLEPLAKIIENRPIQPNQLIPISYSKPFLAQFKERFPEFKAYLILKFERKPPIIGKHQPGIDQVIQSLKELRVDGLDCKAQTCVDRDFIKQLNKAGYPLILWTVNDLDEAKKYRDLGALALTTDRPGTLLEFFRDYNERGIGGLR